MDCSSTILDFTVTAARDTGMWPGRIMPATALVFLMVVTMPPVVTMALTSQVAPERPAGMADGRTTRHAPAIATPVPAITTRIDKRRPIALCPLAAREVERLIVPPPHTEANRQIEARLAMAGPLRLPTTGLRRGIPEGTPQRHTTKLRNRLVIRVVDIPAVMATRAAAVDTRTADRTRSSVTTLEPASVP